MMRLIGLTGGIATGKSTVADYLATKYGLPILDADIYAREAVEAGSEIFNKIVDKYGESILLPNGQLDRAKLGEIIFNSVADRQWLEGEIHPNVKTRLIAASQFWIQQATSAAIILVIPLLFEAKMADLVTEIWVVYCDQNQQLERLIRRNNLSLEAAKKRINSQFPLKDKCDLADVVLDNTTTRESLLQQIDFMFS
jgi:dephospho-CoA kinase